VVDLDAPFSGVPFVVKDLGAEVAGLPHTRGSRLFVDDVAVADSELVDRGLAARYFTDALGWSVDGSVVRMGSTVVLLDEDPDAPIVEMPVRGWTYLTVQIHDRDAETAAALTGGATLGQSAITMGEVARFSMVADPWGNQVELSQRASLTGPLPPDPG